MRQLLIVTFDLIRDNEPDKSLAVGYLMSYLRKSQQYGHEFVADHLSFNLYERRHLEIEEVIEAIARKCDVGKLDAIAIGCYVWSDHLTNNLIAGLRSNGYRKKIILGGYQISYSDGLQAAYPSSQILLMGYAEESRLQSVFIGRVDEPTMLSMEPDFASMPSPYLSGEIDVRRRQGRVRLETKRGCPYRCSFCAHTDLQRHKVYSHPNPRVFDELRYLKDKAVRKINVIDPVFNSGDSYLAVLQECCKIGVDSKITLQTNFDNIKGKNGEMFLDLCSCLDVVLEFGIETMNPQELAVLNKVNDVTHMKAVLKKVRDPRIPFEVNLLYGLPFQTIDSFRSSIRFLRDNGCPKINAFPLILLNGTQLWYEKDRWGCVESCEGYFDLPVVVSCDSFGTAEWEAMKEIAGALRRKYRNVRYVS